MYSLMYLSNRVYFGHNIHMAIKYNTYGMKTCFVFGNEWNVDFQSTMKEIKNKMSLHFNAFVIIPHR